MLRVFLKGAPTLKSLSVRVKRTIKTVPTLQAVRFVVGFWLLFYCLFVFLSGKFFLFPLVTDVESDQLQEVPVIPAGH